MVAVYSKARPYLPQLNAAAAKVGVPEELLRHVWIVRDDANDPSLIDPFASELKSAIDHYYPWIKKGASWRDVLHFAATELVIGRPETDFLMTEVREGYWDDLRLFLDRRDRKKVAGPGRSMIWDFTDWEWFPANYKPPKSWLWLWAVAGISIPVIIIYKKKKKRK